MIPVKYTCDGDDISPLLHWQGIPDNAKSIALIVDDPDAPGGTFVHWVLYNLPAYVNSLHENVPSEQELENLALQGTNNFGNIGYSGPCPPGGTHRYYFKVYALDSMLNIEPGLQKGELLYAMQDHILDEGQIMGKYSRQ